jgi:hypothetical protein
MKQLLLCLLVILVSSCSVLNNYVPPFTATKISEVGSLINQDLANIGEPRARPSVAIYPTSFTDQTGGNL